MIPLPRLLFTLAIASLLPCCASAQWVYTKIADTNTAIPNGSGNFTSFDRPSILNGVVAFNGNGNSQSGIYSSSGGTLSTVADLSTAIPSGTGSFIGFASPVMQASGQTTFFGLGSSGQQGVYAQTGSLNKLIDLNTAIPNGAGNFTSYGGWDLSNSTLAFTGSGNTSQGGVYTNNGGTNSRIADTTTPIPSGTGNFASNQFGSVGISGNSTVFQGGNNSNGTNGIYKDVGGTLSLVANMNTNVPSGAGTFTNNFNQPVVSGSNVAFYGQGVGSFGLYSQVGVTLSRIVDSSTAIPGGTGNFTSFPFSNFSLSGSTLAFIGRGSGSQVGIYVANLDGSNLTRLLGNGDILDGQTITNLGMTQDSYEGNDISFFAAFNNGNRGIYTAIAAVPEPTTWVQISLAIATATCFGYRRLSQTKRKWEASLGHLIRSLS